MAVPHHRGSGAGSPVGRDAASSAEQGIRMMVAAGLVLGTIGVFVAEAGVDPLTAVVFRCVFGAIALGGYAAWRGRRAELTLTRAADWRTALLTTALMILNWALFFTAIRMTSISVATVTFHVQPLWVIAAGSLWLGEPLSRRWTLAALAALVGLALATGFADADFRATPDFVVGVAAALAASLCFAGVTLIAKTTRGTGSLALAFWQCAFGAVLLAFWPLRHGLPSGLSTWGWLVGLGVVHTALVYALLYEGMRRLTSGQIGLLQFVYPGVAIMLDTVVYGHVPSPLAAIGMVVMFVSLWFARATPQGTGTKIGGGPPRQRTATSRERRVALLGGVRESVDRHRGDLDAAERGSAGADPSDSSPSVSARSPPRHRPAPCSPAPRSRTGRGSARRCPRSVASG